MLEKPNLNFRIGNEFDKRIFHRISATLLLVRTLGEIFTFLSQVQYMAKERDSRSLQPFQVLGYLSFLQLACSALLHLYFIYQQVAKQRKETHLPVHTRSDNLRFCFMLIKLYKCVVFLDIFP